jgi:hypothetical protein
MVTGAIIAVAAFAFGVLFGRNNKGVVEKAVAEYKRLTEKKQ